MKTFVDLLIFFWVIDEIIGNIDIKIFKKTIMVNIQKHKIIDVCDQKDIFYAILCYFDNSVL